MLMVSLCLSAQNVKDFISEKTKDAAYSAPNTTLVNKKWFFITEDLEGGVGYYFFRGNKTGELVQIGELEDCTYERVTPITWSRDHNDFKISFNFKGMTYRKLVYKDPSASERIKAEIKKGLDVLTEEKKNDLRGIDSYISEYYINRLDAKLFLLQGQWTQYMPLAKVRCLSRSANRANPIHRA